ncbi:MAG: flagellar biosynthesis anti-sigma factor FlgM [Acidobacteriia bacterium]|jgi:flagellar biosynthesis anti-sigma factor FlgM|nr:flagellar biosynthesis anti-sigma factor FlgM [Terriglobia bacterium]
MRVDLTTFAMEPPDSGKASRAGQTGVSGSTSAASSTSGSISGHDQTRFSFDQVRMQSLEAQVLAQPEIRAAKVEPLQQAIREGAYSLPASRIAEALIREAAGRRG